MRNVTGENIRRLRKELGFSQHEFAKTCMLSFTCINNIECGRSIGRPSTLAIIAEALGCTVEDLNRPRLTYGEMIRHMEDEKMAHFLSEQFCHGYGEEQFLAWLRTPVEE